MRLVDALSHFGLLKGLQTGVTLTALLLTVTCGSALLRASRQDPKPDGYWMALAILLTIGASIIPYGYITASYWLYDIDRPILTPIWLRTVYLMLFLTGGALFVATTQAHPHERWPVFWLWSCLIGAIVLIVTVTA